jgi:hypothetical protein
VNKAALDLTRNVASEGSKNVTSPESLVDESVGSTVAKTILINTTR